MRGVAWAAIAVACAPAEASTPVVPAVTQPRIEKPVTRAPEEPAGPTDPAEIWDRAIAGDIERARRGFAWFVANPPEKRFDSVKDYRPEVVCSNDAGRCAFSIMWPAGVGVVDASGAALRRFVAAMDRPFAFVGSTHLLFVSGSPGVIVDVDTGQTVLDLPESGWSTVDIDDERVVFALDGLRPAKPDSKDPNDFAQRVGVWDAASRSLRFDQTSELGGTPEASVSEDGSWLVVGSDSGAYAWTLSDRRLAAAATHPGVAAPVSARGDHVALASYGKSGAEVRLVDRSGKIVARSRACAKPRVVEIAPSGKLVAVVGDHVCVLRVPSLVPVWKSARLPAVAEDWAAPNEATFLANDSVLLVGTGAGEATLYEFTGKRRQRAAGHVVVRPTRDGAIALIDSRAKELVVLRDFHEASRRALNESELADVQTIAELGEPRVADRAAEVAAALRPRLCMAYGYAFPPTLCAR